QTLLCQKPVLTKTTRCCPHLSSSGKKVRPRIGCTPSNGNSPAVMSTPSSRAGSWFWTDTLNVSVDDAAIPVNEWFCACQARKSGAEDPLFPSPCEINVDQMNTNLLASLYGRLSSKTAFTTEKIAVF